MKKILMAVVKFPVWLVQFLVKLGLGIYHLIQKIREMIPKVKKMIDLGKKGVKFGTMGWNFLQSQKAKKEAENAQTAS